MLFQKLGYQRRPDRHCVRGIDHEVSVTSEGGQHAIFDIAALLDKGLMHPLRQFRPEIGVVLRVDPKHRYPRGASKLAGGGNKLVGCTIVVGSAINAASTPRREGNDGLN